MTGFAINPDPLSDDNVLAMFAAGVAPRLAPTEELGDVLNAGIFVARQRGDLLERPAWSIDGIFAFSLFCWWPGKPELNPEVVRATRTARQYVFFEDPGDRERRLRQVVPDELLRLGLEDLYQNMRQNGTQGQPLRM